jgi:DNA-binding response OmpR family regulator
MPQTILIIEDDVLLAGAIAKKLQLEHFETLIERDGAVGLQLARQHKPALVLLDVFLPSMNGYEILEARMQDQSLSTIPFLVLSNSGQPVEVNRLTALGASSFIVKSDMDPNDVLERVRTTLASPIPPVPAAAATPPPMAVIAPSPKLTPAEMSRALSGKHVLLVEDDVFLSNLLTAKLGSTGCISTQAKSGEEAVEIVGRPDTTLDMILLDLTLPGMSGFDVIPHIRGSERFKATPIVVLSNLSQETDIARATSLGAKKYLVKAERDPDEIVSEIATAL